MAPQFRADQIGSLLRPPELLEARLSLSSSSQMYEIHNDDEIQAAEKKAIQWAVQKQREHSIRPICSGEYTRHIFYGGLFETLEGMTVKQDLPIIEAFRADFPTVSLLCCSVWICSLMRFLSFVFRQQNLQKWARRLVQLWSVPDLYDGKAALTWMNGRHSVRA